jgi:hypothetical protein
MQRLARTLIANRAIEMAGSGLPSYWFLYSKGKHISPIQATSTSLSLVAAVRMPRQSRKHDVAEKAGDKTPLTHRSLSRDTELIGRPAVSSRLGNAKITDSDNEPIVTPVKVKRRGRKPPVPNEADLAGVSSTT